MAENRIILGIDTKKEFELYEKTMDKLNTAIINAKKVKKKHIDNNIELISRESTPLTLVYRVLELIDSFK